MRRALIRFVNNVEMRRKPEVDYLQHKKQHGDYAVQQICIHINLINNVDCIR